MIVELPGMLWVAGSKNKILTYMYINIIEHNKQKIERKCVFHRCNKVEKQLITPYE